MSTLDDALLALNPDALIATDSDGRVLRWNEGASAIFGFAAHEASGCLIENLTVPADHVAEHRALLERLGRLGQARSETVRRRKDGSLIHVDILARVVDLPDGRHVLWAKRDITDRHRAAEKFRGLLEAAPDAIVIVDPTGCIVLANSQADTLFGYARADLIGQPVERLLPESFRAMHARHRSAFVAQPRVRSMGAGLELIARRSDGTQFPVEISLSPLATEEGTLVSAAIRDMTERKAVERQLQEQNLQLASANQAKSQFLASMSHELRTPLNAIIGFTGTLLMGLPGPLNVEQQSQLRIVQRSGQHLLALINDLLDLTRIESGKVEMQLARVNCHDVALTAVEELRSLADGKGLALTLESPDDQVMVTADARALLQILLNLLGNALKYTEQGSVRLQVVTLHTGMRHTVEVRITDTGIGIAAKDHERLFKAFSQVGEPHRATEGAGLGLYLSIRMAELIGGLISYQSKPGVGSTFTLTLPAA